MMKKILIISPYFYPNINPRPYRWTKIAEYWVEKGYEVHVLAEKKAFSPNEKIKVHSVGFAALKSFLGQQRGEVKGEISKPSLKSRFFRWVNESFWKKIYFPDDSCIWYFSAKKKANELCQKHDFDLLISSSLPFTPHLIGLFLKKNYPNLTWIADTGDPFSLQKEEPLNNHFLYQKWNLFYDKKVMQYADYVTVTTKNCKKLYEESFPEYGSKFKTILPLLTISGNDDFEISLDENQINIAYFGKFYQKVREPRSIISLFENIFEEYPLFREKIKIHIFGDIFENFVAELQKPYLVLHGLLEREKVNAAMQKFDFLLNISNQTDYQLPSKAPDYMNSGKPILNVFFVENDCFQAFFEKYPLIINLKSDDFDKKTLIDFLEKNKNIFVPREKITPLLEDCYVEKIAEKYLALNHEL